MASAQPVCTASQAEVNVELYNYSTLPEGYFRLIGIDFAAGGSEIRGVIEEHSLDNPPPYTALSYCWGTATGDH
jgi:hypothetical protein